MQLMKDSDVRNKGCDFRMMNETSSDWTRVLIVNKVFDSLAV